MSNFFILTDGPVASPSSCGICGYSGADRRFLDPRKDFEFYGSFIICEPCVGSMAQDFDFIQPAQARALEARVKEADRELETLRSAIQQLESVHDLITNFNFKRSDNGPGSVAGSFDAAADRVSNSPVKPKRPAVVEKGSGNIPADNNDSEPRSDDLSDIVVGADKFSKSF